MFEDYSMYGVGRGAQYPFPQRRSRRGSQDLLAMSRMHPLDDALAADRQEASDRMLLVEALGGGRLRDYVACLATGNHHLLSATVAMRVCEVFGGTDRGSELRPWSELDERELGGVIRCWQSLGALQVDSGGSGVIRAPVHAPVSGERFLVELRAREDMEIADAGRFGPPPVSPRRATDDEWRDVLGSARPSRAGGKEKLVTFALLVRYGRPEAGNYRLPSPDLSRGASEREVCNWAADLRYWIARAIRDVESAMPQLLAQDDPLPSRAAADIVPPADVADASGGAMPTPPLPCGDAPRREGGRRREVTFDMTTAAGVLRMLEEDVPRGTRANVFTPF